MNMNKTEKIVCLVLGAVLAWYLFVETPRQAKERQKASAEAALAASVQGQASTNGAPASAEVKPAAAEPAAISQNADRDEPIPDPSVPERTVVLENDELRLELSTWGAVVKKATLKKYARGLGPVGEGNPPVVFDFSKAPLGELGGVKGLAPNAAYEVRSSASNEVVFANGVATRAVTLGSGYKVVYREEFRGEGGASPLKGLENSISLGVMAMGSSKNDLLSVDSLDAFNAKGREEVVHHCEGDSPLKAYLVGGLSGGCSSAPNAAGMPRTVRTGVRDEQKWVAVKNRFFVTALASSDAVVSGFDADISRDVNSATYRPESVAVRAFFRDAECNRTTTFYVGPKKQSLLWDLGMRDVMEFGMWRWLCYPLVWVLNLFNDWIPNYGVAIILLTILVRLLFWPLTHKSTVGMRKMQEIQPRMKEIQAKFKDNPQRLQQETWALYREAKVNPMSSCLPMLVQIPVFIALFNVLRSAVELRYAPFLWIGDLSEPEGLGAASWFPFFGGLNVLPVLMAATTALQSAFTPSAGDKNQQKMMMIAMPAMMLVMFYSFPSALSLYWFLSNVFSIVQMWIIRRRTPAKGAAAVPEVIDPPVTRQMRRHR
ncbi:MAG: YidC/Oxa1 family insertase periplasmic-domain containing protein [Kiritimatiellae bacterium]|nr:YidC/Oxa1 family insertase periplasmic-domain containing protein [Kiritimatiellia bacterium]